MSQGSGTTMRDGAYAGHAWERWWWLWDAVFYALLVVSVGLVLFGDTGPWGGRGVAVALSVVLAGWYWGLVGRSPRLRGEPWRTQTCAAGLLPLALALIWVDPVFHLLLFGLYGLLYGLLPLRWAIPAALLLSGGVVLRALTLGGASSGTIVAIVLILIGTGIGVIFALWITAIIEQSGRRQGLIDELATTRRELAAA